MKVLVVIFVIGVLATLMFAVLAHQKKDVGFAATACMTAILSCALLFLISGMQSQEAGCPWYNDRFTGLSKKEVYSTLSSYSQEDGKIYSLAHMHGINKKPRCVWGSEAFPPLFKLSGRGDVAPIAEK